MTTPETEEEQQRLTNLAIRIAAVCDDLFSPEGHVSILDATEIKDVCDDNGRFQVHVMIPTEGAGVAARMRTNQVCAVIGREDGMLDVILVSENGTMGVAAVMDVEGHFQTDGLPVSFKSNILEEGDMDIVRLEGDDADYAEQALIRASLQTLIAWTEDEEDEGDESSDGRFVN